MTTRPNQRVETNRRPASTLDDEPICDRFVRSTELVGGGRSTRIVEHEEMMMKSLIFLASVVIIAVNAFGADEEYEKANRDGAFIICHNGYSAVSIGVDTTNPDLLKLAIELQETIFALGGARPPIENIGPAVGPGNPSIMWRMIYFVQDLHSIGEQPLYTEVPDTKFLQFALRANFIKFFLQKTRQKYPCIGL